MSHSVRICLVLWVAVLLALPGCSGDRIRPKNEASTGRVFFQQDFSTVHRVMAKDVRVVKGTMHTWAKRGVINNIPFVVQPKALDDIEVEVDAGSVSGEPVFGPMCLVRAGPPVAYAFLVNSRGFGLVTRVTGDGSGSVVGSFKFYDKGVKPPDGRPAHHLLARCRRDPTTGTATLTLQFDGAEVGQVVDKQALGGFTGASLAVSNGEAVFDNLVVRER